MVVKGIILSVSNKYKVYVRIPQWHGVEEQPLSTPNNLLPLATIVCSPGQNLHYTAGDIVYVAFENNDNCKPVIIGKLFRENDSQLSTLANNVSSLHVDIDAILPEGTLIGDITYKNIKSLSNINGNIQNQFNNINDILSSLLNKIDLLQTRVNELEGGDK